MPTIFDWRELPFRELWCVDTEFYPGAGLANGGVEGDPSTPLCLVALEMRSGRTVRLWQSELGPFPPYRLDPDALFMSYALPAEFGVHIAKGWGEPACALDPYVEFRHYVNSGAIKAEDRDKGFYGISGALRFFCEDEIDIARNTDLRDRIIQGPPFSAQEQQDILAYCEDDVRALCSFPISSQPSARCHTRLCAPSSSGRWPYKSVAGFRSIDRRSRAFGTTGRACVSILSANSTARSVVMKSSMGWRIGAKSVSPVSFAGTA